MKNGFVEGMLKTIESIVRSAQVEEYNIGITVNPKRRRSQYVNWSPVWPNFAILEGGLHSKRALKIEREIYDEIRSNKRSVLFKKYRVDTKYGAHTPSLGGLPVNNDREYFLYIAWGNVGDN